MKRLLLITLVSITLLSCSKDDEYRDNYWADIKLFGGEEERVILDLQVYNCYETQMTTLGSECYRGRDWDCDLDQEIECIGEIVMLGFN